LLAAAAAAAADDDGGGGDDYDDLGFILNPIRLLMLVIVRGCCWILIILNNSPHVLSLESFFPLIGMLMEPMSGFAGERERNGIVCGELKRWQESFCREEGEGIPTHRPQKNSIS
jgi:hypothetical protein